MKKRAGFTLVELMVSMVILGIIGGIASEMIVKSLRNNKVIEAQSIVHRDVSNALDKFSRVTRSTTQILEVTATTLKVRAYPDANDTVPSEIYFYVSGGNSLRYTVIPPTGTAPNYTYSQSNAKEYILVSKISTVIPSSPIFKYYNDTNTLLALPTTLASVKAIEICISALDKSNYLTTPIVESTVVNLRNFKTNL